MTSQFIRVGRILAGGVLTSLLIIFYFSRAEAAISTNSATSLINFNNQTIKASSTPSAIIGLNLVSNLETFASTTINVNGSAGFATSTDLTALSTSTSSGIAIYRDNKTSGIFGTFDSADTVVTLVTTPVWVGATTTLTFAAAETVPVNDTGNNAGNDYFVVFRTAATAVNGHIFSVSLYPGSIGYSAATPTSTPAALTTNTITIDTDAPTINTALTRPSNNATNVPVSALINVVFSENIDSSTVNSTNVVLTTGGSSVGTAFRTFPNAFSVVVSNPPTYLAGASFAKVASTKFGFYNIFGTQPILPLGEYATPVLGDIVLFQHDTFPAVLGVVTNATMTSGTFTVNNLALTGGQAIIKFATPTLTGLVSATTTLTAGDIIVANTATNPTSDRYAWHIVTTGGTVDGAGTRLDAASAQPGYVSGSSFSKITPSATSTTSASGQIVQGMNFASGAMIFGKVSAGADNLNTYAWHIVTTGQVVGVNATSTTMRLDGATTAVTFAPSSAIAQLTPSAQGAVTDSSTSFVPGDVVLTSTTANAANNGSYAFHIISNSAMGANSTNLRFDNSSVNLLAGTAYTLTIGTEIKDRAGNSLATAQTINFTTGSTGGTNTTPPFVLSSSPANGNQNFPTNAPINIQFSQDMATSGSGSALSSTNVGIHLDAFGVPGASVSAVSTYDALSRTVTLTPSSALTASTRYIVQVANTATSATGAPMSKFLASFKSSATTDTTKPTVLGIFPASGATSVARNQNTISVGFSESMNSTAINSTTMTLSGGITGTVSYNPSSNTAFFSPTVPLAASTVYTLTVTTGAADLAGNTILLYTSTFTTASPSDSAAPSVLSGNADNFGIAVTFSEAMKNGTGPNAVENISNYTIESPVGSSISLGGKTATYDGPTMTVKISGLSLQTGNTFKVILSSLVQDISGNGISTASGPPPANGAFGAVVSSALTGGLLAQGSGPQQAPGLQGMSPVRVIPANKGAGATSGYSVEFPVTASIPVGGSVVLTFPTGFNVAGAAASTAGTESFRNGDINGPAAGTVTIASVTPNTAAGTITIVTGGAVTGVNAFISLDLKGIVNSTIPSTAGYTIDVKTRDTTANNSALLESQTAAPFFLGQLGSNTLTVQVFHDDDSNNVMAVGEQINSARVFLFSPSLGGSTALTSSGAATFSNLSNGDYMLGIDSGSVGSYAVNGAPQSITISGNTTKKYALGASGSTLTITGTVTGPNGTSVDVFGSSQSGFTKTTITLTGGADAYSLPVQANTTHQVGVGPSIPASFMAPGALPPPLPTFNFMPPANLTVKVLSANITGKNFTLASASKTITITALDASGSGVNGAGVFARPVSSATSGGDTVGFGTGGQTDTQGNATLNVVPGVYLVGIFKPGMPSVGDKEITVPVSGANTPSTLTFKLNAGTTLTITGTIKDDNGTAIPYAGVSARKVTSTSDTTSLGGGTQNSLRGQSDANGAYTLYTGAGVWVVEAFAPGFGRLGTKTVTVGEASLTGQDFSAETLSMGTITGTATKASIAQQGVMVRAEGANGVNMVSTDATGAYSLKAPAGTYTISCLFPGVGESTPLTGVTVTANTTTSGQACALSAPITLTVNVTDGTNPIRNAFVDVRDSNGRGNGTSLSVASTTHGVYTVVVPSGGTYTVRAGHPAYGQIGITAGVSGTGSITYTASAGQAFAVTGTVQANSAALNGAWVSIVGVPTGQTNTINVGAQTSSSGTFLINVPAGSYRIRGDKPGFKSPAEATLTVSTTTSAGTITLTTASRTITGVVTISGSGTSGAVVDATDGSGGFAVAQTDASGAYSLAVDNGTWKLRSRAMGYEGGPLTVVVESNSPSGQTIALSAMSGFTMKQERQETITPASGGLITNSDISGGFKLDIPANALGTGSNAGTITTQVNTAIPTPVSGAVMAKNAITISAVDASGQPITQLNGDIIVVIPYTEADIPAGQKEETLVLGVWNDATKSYDILPAIIDTTANTLTASLSHFSDVVPMFSSDTPAAASSGGGSGSGGGASGGGGSATAKPLLQTVHPAGNVISTAPTSKISPYTRTLNLGMKGGDVIRLQAFLESKGFLVMPKDVAKGYFGAGTRRALITYQKSVELPAFGIFGPLTQASIEGKGIIAKTTTAPEFPGVASVALKAPYSRILYSGMKGGDVIRLQAFLESKGFLVMPKGVAKGYFGAGTKLALIAYQQSVRLQAFGIFGPLTQAKVMTQE